MDFTTHKYCVDPRPSFPLQILATRYTLNAAIHKDDGYTLVFMHATGMHKETYEITAKRLLELCARDGGGSNVRDILSIESPNHGESAVLNEKALEVNFGDSWPTKEYARSAYIFLTASLQDGLDFSSRKLIGVGHSVGAAALFLMRDFTPRVDFQSIIALEPGISLKDIPGTLASSQVLTRWAWLRRDVWPTRSAAKNELTSTPVFKSWDPRVLELYIRYGLRRHPAAKYTPPFSFEGVTTCLTKVQEAATYRSEHLVVDAMDAYTALTQQIPVHLIFGECHDVGSPELQKILHDAGAGRTPASVNYIKEAGHLVVQQKPDVVAEMLHSILLSPISKL